jgi:glycosyltransferase involved in cell wall biosynthesis
VSVSQFVGAKLREAGVLHDRIRVKPNFAWPNERREGEGDYFLVLGRLSREKGFDRVVGNLPWGARLLVVGDGPERAHLTSLAGRGVEFRGAVAESEVQALLRRTRALLVPSRCYEGQPRVILEAFAAGVPVLASSLGGLPELVEDGVNGLLISPNDNREWRLAVEQLMDLNMSNRLGAGAYRTWETNFTPHQALGNLESVYSAVVSGDGSAICR